MIELARSDTTYHQFSRLDEYLALWATWTRQYRPRLGYPAKAAGFLTGGSVRSWEDLVHQGDHYAARTMDGLINSLPVAQQCAVRTAHLGECWHFPRDNYEELYENARAALESGRIKWGLV